MFPNSSRTSCGEEFRRDALGNNAGRCRMYPPSQKGFIIPLSCMRMGPPREKGLEQQLRLNKIARQMHYVFRCLIDVAVVPEGI